MDKKRLMELAGVPTENTQLDEVSSTYRKDVIDSMAEMFRQLHKREQQDNPEAHPGDIALGLMNQLHRTLKEQGINIS